MMLNHKLLGIGLFADSVRTGKEEHAIIAIVEQYISNPKTVELSVGIENVMISHIIYINQKLEFYEYQNEL